VYVCVCVCVRVCVCVCVCVYSFILSIYIGKRKALLKSKVLALQKQIEGDFKKVPLDTR